MALFQAGEQDFLRLQAFYKNLIATPPDMRQFCPWEYGVYPTDALLREHIVGVAALPGGELCLG